MFRPHHHQFFLATLLATTSNNMEVRALSQASATVKRKFQYVPYGASAPDGITTIACDGRVPGATLEVTHWTGNETPDDLYADTSTAMALNLAKRKDDYPEFASATVLNNHYDTDGVLSVFACLEPEKALEFETLLIQGAEAGDFGEWSSEEGVKLDCAISALLSSDEEESYENALEVLPELASDIALTGGASFENLWRPGFDDALSGWEDLESGRAKLWRAAPSIVVLEEADQTSFMSPYALHRGLKERNLWEGTTRILRTREVGAASFRYNYEKIGHGWVAKLVERPNVPGVDAESLSAAMNKKCSVESWKAGGNSGLVSICCTKTAQDLPPKEIAKLLSACDSGTN